MLKFKGKWRAEPPADGELYTASIPEPAINEFRDLIGKVATQGDRQNLIEHFKGYFVRAVGSTHVWSSSESWAETDLRTYMYDAAANAPLFLEALYDACEDLRRAKDEDFFVPDVSTINAICKKYDVGYVIQPPELLLRDSRTPLVAVPERPKTFAEESFELMQKSLSRSEEQLHEGHGREAVQELLWLLESVTTAFRGLDTGSAVIGGKYFNQIVRELRASYRGTTLERVLEWASALHGFLSSPTGGGIRHGVDLTEGVATSQDEARLYCNLIRSYMSFLLAEYERLSKGRQ